MSLHSSYCASQWCLVTESGQAVGLLPRGYLWSRVWGSLGECPKARNWEGAVVGRRWAHCQRGQVRVDLNERRCGAWLWGGEDRKNTVQERGAEIWLTNPPPLGRHRQKSLLLFNQRCLLKDATPVAQRIQFKDWCAYKGSVSTQGSSGGWHIIWYMLAFTQAAFRQHLPGSSDSKASAYNVGDPGSIPGSGRSPGEGNGNPLQYSCLENPMDLGFW